MKYSALLFLITTSIAFAYSDGPDTFRVRGLKRGEELNLRTKHSGRAPILIKIPRGTKGIRNLGESWPHDESDVPPTKESLANRTDLTPEEKAALLKGQSWCKIEYKRKTGWALCKYLGE